LVSLTSDGVDGEGVDDVDGEGVDDGGVDDGDGDVYIVGESEIEVVDNQREIR